MNNKETVEVSRSDLIFLQRAMEAAFAELEGPVHEGDIDESVLVELDEVVQIVKEYLR